MIGLVRQVAQALVHQRWYTVSILTVTAVAFALLSSVFAVVDGVLFKPLGYPNERRLVAITVFANRSRLPAPVEADDLAAWSRSAPGVQFTGFRVQPIDASTSLARAFVQSNFFDVVGVRPAVGGFAAEDFYRVPARIEPRIVTDDVFRHQFNGDPAAIGRIVILDPSNGYGYRVVGVMPRGFVFPASQWSVGYLTTYAKEGSAWFNHIIARMPPGVSAGDLRRRVLAAASASGVRVSSSSSTWPVDHVDVQALGRALAAPSRALFGAVLAAVGFLVAIAALNTSSLMAARTVDRGNELVLRRALGATSWQIRRLLGVEAMFLVGGGALLGLMIAGPLLQVTVPLLPRDLALFRVAAIDGRVVAFTVLVGSVLTCAVTVWPLRLAGARSTTLKPGQNVTGRVRSLSRRLIVTVQVSVALTLTVAGFLLVASLLSVYGQSPPVATSNITSVTIRFLGAESAVSRLSPERTLRANTLLKRLRNVHGVDAVALTAYDLLDRAYVRSWFKTPTTALNPRMPVIMQAVTADYYRIVQPQLVAGRLPTDMELVSDSPVIVVSGSVASNYWPDASAIGQILTDAETNRTFTVVGIVKDVRWYSWDEDALPTVYGPYGLLARLGSGVFLIRASAGISGVGHDAVRAISETDPLVRTDRVAPLRGLFVDSVRPRRFQAWLFGSFAAASLLVVAIGIFGQLAVSTARRTREVGIRMTCGATRGAIVGLIFREQLAPVLAGLLAGGIAAAWAVRFLASFLYQITSFDLRVWVGAIGLILAVAAAGALVPALRASRVDPTQALRLE